MEIAGLILSGISTTISVISFVWSLLSKREAHQAKEEIKYIIENNPNIKVSGRFKLTQKKTSKSIVKGNNNIVSGRDTYVR